MTSLKIIISSKFNKTKRQKHIAEMEKELGVGQDMHIESNHTNSVSNCSHVSVPANRREMPTLSDEFVMPNGKNFKMHERVKSTIGYEREFHTTIKGIVIDNWLLSHADPALRRGYDIRLDDGTKLSINGYWLEAC